VNIFTPKPLGELGSLLDVEFEGRGDDLLDPSRPQWSRTSAA
jgi:hypothetical protein